MATKQRMMVGDMIRMVGNYSEVMMHMGLAGRPVIVELIPRNRFDGKGRMLCSAQVYDLYHKPMGAPITTGEAGIYEDADGYYGYEDYGAGDSDPRAVAAELTRQLEDAITSSGVEVKTITNLGL